MNPIQVILTGRHADILEMEGTMDIHSSLQRVFPQSDGFFYTFNGS